MSVWLSVPQKRAFCYTCGGPSRWPDLREPAEGVESTKKCILSTTKEASVRLWALVCALALIAAGSAAAQAPDDRSVCARQQGDESIEACTRAIASGTLSGRALADAHYNRAVTHRTKGAQEPALTDLDIAIQTDPSVAAYFLVRGRVWLIKNE